MPLRLSGVVTRDGYPKQIKDLGDSLRARRVELRLLQKDLASLMGTTKDSISNWELGRTDPELRFYPAISAFLGYDPASEPQSAGQAVKQERLRRGWSMKRLAQVAGSGTV